MHQHNGLSGPLQRIMGLSVTYETATLAKNCEQIKGNGLMGPKAVGCTSSFNFYFDRKIFD